MASRADDPCAAFAWDVRHERALFAAAARPLAAGTTVAASPPLAPDHIYRLQLSALADVAFAVPPARTPGADRAYAGLARLTVGVAGVYRISLDQAAWLDVVADGAAIRSQGFEGRPGCNAPHKIVEFLLPAGVPLTLQLSGAAGPGVTVAVTRSPRQRP
ncbi:MAG TPA: hypothetical protein VMU00_03035 [Steroidobacteraceae bacterium]|nr:hypothetical protein [Steroidobacteraceae bacterium]